MISEPTNEFESTRIFSNLLLDCHEIPSIQLIFATIPGLCPPAYCEIYWWIVKKYLPVNFRMHSRILANQDILKSTDG